MSALWFREVRFVSEVVVYGHRSNAFDTSWGAIEWIQGHESGVRINAADRVYFFPWHMVSAALEATE